MLSISILSTIIIIIILILLIIFNKFEGFMDLVDSHINGKSYLVQEDLPDQVTAANKLAKVELFIKSFMNYLNNNYLTDPRIERLNENLKEINLQESEIEKGVSSYTVNKGELISVCVRDKKNLDEFHDYQLILFVIIHELAHVASKTYGHNDEFHTNFKWLLEEAVNVGYIPQNYTVNPVTYCGVDVTNNPILN